VRAAAPARRPLKGDAIVATVMSNIGLQVALAETGIGLVRCPVGDKYVMEEMLRADLSLGGEQSGHIIFSDYLFTGDGLCTALNVCGRCVSGRTLADLAVISSPTRRCFSTCACARRSS
jgi:phosphoglucosamine mutase